MCPCSENIQNLRDSLLSWTNLLSCPISYTLVASFYFLESFYLSDLWLAQILFFVSSHQGLGRCVLLHSAAIPTCRFLLLRHITLVLHVYRTAFTL